VFDVDAGLRKLFHLGGQSDCAALRRLRRRRFDREQLDIENPGFPGTL